MKDKSWDLNQTWPVGWKWCWFTNAPQKHFGPQIWAQKHQTFDHFSWHLHFTPHISGTKRRIDKQKC